jgi:phenylalanyl-tRNA synthetase alpha subunit
VLYIKTLSKNKTKFQREIPYRKKEVGNEKKKKLLDFKKSHPSIPNEYSTFHGEEQNILQKMIDCL